MLTQQRTISHCHTSTYIWSCFFSDGLDLSEQVFKGEIRSAKDMENLTHSQGALNYEMILRPDKSNIATFGTSKLNLSCFLCCFYM